MASGYFVFSPETVDFVLFNSNGTDVPVYIPKDQRIFYYNENAGTYWVKKAFLLDHPDFGDDPEFISHTYLTETVGMEIYKLDAEFDPNIDFGKYANMIGVAVRKD